MSFLGDVGNWFKNAGQDVYKEVIKPVVGAGVSIGGKIVDRGFQVADQGIRQAGAFGDILTNPIMIGMALIAAIILVPPILGAVAKL